MSQEAKAFIAELKKLLEAERLSRPAILVLINKVTAGEHLQPSRRGRTTRVMPKLELVP